MTRKSIVVAYNILLLFSPSSTSLPPKTKQESSVVFVLNIRKNDQEKIIGKIQQPSPVKYQLSIDRMMGLFSLLDVSFLKEGSQNMVVLVNI